MTVATIAGVGRARPVVEVGVGSVNEPAGGAAWQPAGGGPVGTRWQNRANTAAGQAHRWVGRDPFWWDVTCDTLLATTAAGRERADALWDVGTATVTVRNATGWADFPPTDVQQTFLTVRPGRPVRVGVVVDEAVHVTLWSGYIDAQSPGYDAEGGETVVLDCIDAKGDAGRAVLAALTAAVGANETAPQRITRYLDAQHWPSWRRDLAASSIALLATMMGAPGVDLMNLAADSAGGFVFGDKAGRVAFRPRDWMAFAEGDPVAGAIGNFGTGTETGAGPPVELVESPAGSGLYDPAQWFTESPAGSGLYATTLMIVPSSSPGLFTLAESDLSAVTCPVSWELMFARADISTKVIVGRRTDAAQTPPVAPVVREDAVARNLYGTESFTRTDLETRDTVDLEHFAERVLAVRSPDFMPRVVAVTLDAATADNVIDTIVAADPYVPARFYCRHRGANGRTVFTRTMLVVGVEHTIAPDSWVTRIALDDAAPFTQASPARWSDGATATARWNNKANPNALRSAWARAV